MPKDGKNVKRDSGTGKLEKSGFAFCLTKAQLIKWIEAVISNTFVAIGTDLVLHQSKGLPMGVAPAVWMVQFFCFLAELKFHRRVLRLKRFDITRAFRFTTRYIDDILAMANKFIKHLLSERDVYEGIQGIYRKCLVLTTEQEKTDGEVTTSTSESTSTRTTATKPLSTTRSSTRPSTRSSTSRTPTSRVSSLARLSMES